MSELSDQRETTNDLVKPERGEPLGSEVHPPPSGGQADRLASWLQFPRRVVLLLIAYGLASALIIALRGPLGNSVDAANLNQELDWTLSLATGGPVVELISERMPNTLLLLTAALFLALFLALVAILMAVLVHKLEELTGPLGSVLKGLGRLWIFGSLAMPVFGMGMLLIFIFAVQLELLPAFGMSGAVGSGGLAERIRHLLLPTVALAFLPAALTAQTVAREVTLLRERTGIRTWLTGLFKGLGTLSGQIGGLLSGLVLVEIIFSWPGIGKLLFTAVIRRDIPVALGILGTFAGLILIGRLAAELFRWLERLVNSPDISEPLRPSPWRKTARRLWVVAALALLLIPLAVVVSGLVVDPDAVHKTDLRARNSPPSAEHPWGADDLGRDLRARVLRGGLITLAAASGTAVIILIPSVLIGTLTGFLASRRRLWSESAADLLLLPADVLLFIPAVPGAIVITVLLEPGLGTAILATVIVLLPRAGRVFQTLWTAAPEAGHKLTLGLAGLGGGFLGLLFAAFWLIEALGWLGVGIVPPQPSLGSMLRNASQYLMMQPTGVFTPGIVLWLCAFALYTAADALIGFFHSKEVMVRLNE